MKREIHIDVGDLVEKINFEPGDALYFIVPNPREEVNLILERFEVNLGFFLFLLLCIYSVIMRNN